jgi:hypothetical protein
MKKRFIKQFLVESPSIKGKDGDIVTYPVSYKYNGGIIINKKWYDGYIVGQPLVPKGFKLVSIGVGLNLNNQPPLATARLVKVE